MILVYDLATGKPKRLHRGSDRQLARARARLSAGEGAIDGEFGSLTGKLVENGQLIDAAPDAAAALAALRKTRNRLLAESDWTQIPDAPVDQAAWASYRQALRELPATVTDVFDPDWPTPPA